MQYRDETETPGTVRYSFDSLGELGRWIDTTPRTWRMKYSRDESPSNSWDLNAGYDGALELAKNGWAEGAKEAQRTLESLRAEMPAPNEKTDFYGFRPHVPRYCAGAPDCMVRRSNEAGEGKIICLYVPVNALGSVSAKNMSTFGLAVAQYIRQLELDGNRVELYGAFCSRVSGKRLTATWKIKDAGQYLDLAVLCFSIGHPACFRRIGFAFRERCSVKQDPGYGHTVDMVLSDLINAPVGAKIINGMNDGHSTIESALRKIEAQVKE